MDIQRIARDLLRSLGIQCEFAAPNPIPDSIVTVRVSQRFGSTRFEGKTNLKVQAFAKTRGAASALCNKAVDALVGRGEYESAGGLLAANENVTGCSVTSDPFEWPKTDLNDRELWQATVAVDYNR